MHCCEALLGQHRRPGCLLQLVRSATVSDCSARGVRRISLCGCGNMVVCRACTTLQQLTCTVQHAGLRMQVIPIDFSKLASSNSSTHPGRERRVSSTGALAPKARLDLTLLVASVSSA